MRLLKWAVLFTCGIEILIAAAYLFMWPKAPSLLFWASHVITFLGLGMAVLTAPRGNA